MYEKIFWVHHTVIFQTTLYFKDGSDVQTSKQNGYFPSHTDNTKRKPITIDIAPYACIGKLVKTDDSRASRSPENTTETSPGLRIGKDKSTTDSQTSKATLRQNTETEPSNNTRNLTPTMIPNDAEKQHKVTSSGVSQKEGISSKKKSSTTEKTPTGSQADRTTGKSSAQAGCTTEKKRPSPGPDARTVSFQCLCS